MTISGKAIVAGVMGWPVDHSRSPRIHGYWLNHHGVDGAYIPMPVRPDDLGDALRALPKLGMAGVNLTIPHKETSLHLIDSADSVATRIGAVNTVMVDRDGRLRGRNTDAFGFLANLEAGAPGWRPDAGPAVVLGAGGAARAVIVALADAGVPVIRIVNRTQSRAEELADLARAVIEPVPWERRDAALDGAALLVNATSLGMAGQPPLKIDLRALPHGAVVNDIVYVPLITDLLSRASALGLTTVDGLGMLMHQARPGFETWYGVKPQVTERLRAYLLEDLVD